MAPTLEDTAKPQSMPSGPRNVLRSNDSASLWNCTLSPGWSREESDILRKALMKFGIGNWAKIIDSQCLPGKTNAQMNLQLQRMLGQQSTAVRRSTYRSLGDRGKKFNDSRIKYKTQKQLHCQYWRDEIKRRIQQNKQLYEISEEEWNNIKLPKPEDIFTCFNFGSTNFNPLKPQSILESKNEDLRRLQQELESVRAQIANIRRKQYEKDCL
ncbi:1662_t:CDS:2 [Scutellospora calospora]|uniref:1662_t:CDS:1 n=1 Tax=Scutellospora calospora TaxID=85575 RepID=A0ACA9MIX5_9GLOM|nr:1662_t:CDS:2 [Scutellospora calospora]